jgi:GT2 family glycosyltransferase
MATKSSLKPIAPKLDLTISIVSFNTKAHLERCLKSIFKYTKGVSFEVIVVDNDSHDGSIDLIENNFPKVRLIKNSDNKFYTGANNQALAISSGEYFLILNSDIYLKTNAFKEMVDYLRKHPKVGAIEALQVDDKGRAIPTGGKHARIFDDLVGLTVIHKITNQGQAEYKMISFDRHDTWPADVICDAVLMLKTTLLKTLKGYDTKLKLYYTEQDLCKRIQEKGLSTYHVGSIKVYHSISASSNQLSWRKVNKLYAEDGFQYYKKTNNIFIASVFYASLILNNLIIDIKKSFTTSSSP